MKHYDFKTIKQASDCLSFAKSVLDLQECSNGRFNSPFRGGSDSQSFAINKDGYFDHVTKEKGGIIDLCAKVKFSGDMKAAVEFLGEYYNLSPIKLRKIPHNSTRHDELLQQGYNVTKIYQYKNLTGEVVHETLRYECEGKKKQFLQRVDESKWSLKGVEAVLYNLKVINESSWIIFVEGEKDADNLITFGLPATTSAMGAGKWQDSYSQFCKGKNIVILPDNDEPGRAHADLIILKIKDICGEIRIVKTSKKDKGDVSDWLQEGHTEAELLELIKTTPPIDKRLIEEYSEKTAKIANEYGFKNYIPDKDSDGKETKRPVHVDTLTREIFKRGAGFPCLINDTLFYYNSKENRIDFIRNAVAFSVWIQSTSGHPVDFWNGSKFISKEELFESVVTNAKRFSRFCSIPEMPEVENTFYLPIKLPEASEGYTYFNELVNNFSPASDADRTLLKALFIAPIITISPRPCWMIDSTIAQAAGKTTVAQMLALLYGIREDGQSPLGISEESIKNEDEITSRLLSFEASAKRVVLFDNIDKSLSSSFLASMVTEKYISGRRKYARGEESKFNHFTLVLTSNSASFDQDIASRIYTIELGEPKNISMWRSKLIAYISTHRLQILADIIGMIKNPISDYPAEYKSRYSEFDKTVFPAVCEDVFDYQILYAHIVGKAEENNYEASDAQDIEATIINELAQHIDPNIESIFIKNSVFSALFQNFGRYPTRVIRNMIKRKRIPALRITQTGKDKNDKRGLVWIPDLTKSAINLPPIYLDVIDKKILKRCY